MKLYEGISSYLLRNEVKYPIVDFENVFIVSSYIVYVINSGSVIRKIKLIVL